ncbi:AGC/AKT protein kinase [Mycena indigotica]|uniref:AGC/AKT protein kinase n=1 Tax=Mycena indigotica TaxID=2126181 RepID=A0A8H6TA86_9AGAR|nr:AGC/AKT protein kinase [Mycena indigotica]KAF7315035.1 AGC/AKT protein kinase [Mycena indigotica]
MALRSDSSLGEVCEVYESTIDLSGTQDFPHIDIDLLSLDMTPFSESFSGLIDGLDDYDDLRSTHDNERHEEPSYDVEQYSNVNEFDPEWDDEDVEEVMVLTQKQRHSTLPTIREEQDAVSLASHDGITPHTSRRVSLTDFDIIPTSTYPMLCRKRSTSRLYAIKTLDPGFLDENTILESIAALEVPFLERLTWSLPGVADGDEGRIYLILEYNCRESLASLVNAGSLAAIDAHFYACELVDALSSLHDANIVHRDLTPFNIFIDNSGHILLSNFSNATILAQGRQSSLPASATLEYQAPEVFLGWCHNQVADCWSFGIVLQFMLTGENPISDGKNTTTFSDRVLATEVTFNNVECPDARDLIQKCLEKNPALRLTIGDIRNHVYFSTVDWANVRAKKLVTPSRLRTSSPKLRPLSQDFPLPPHSRLSDTSLDFSFTVQRASKAVPTVPRLERVDVGPQRPLLRVRSSGSMSELRSRNQSKRWSLNVSSNSARVPLHRSSHSIHDIRMPALTSDNELLASARHSLQIPTPDMLPPIFRPTPLDSDVAEEEEPSSSSPALSSPTICEPSPRERMARFWDTIDAEEQQRPEATTLELRDFMRLALPGPPLPRSGARMRKRGSLGLLSSQSDNRLSILSSPSSGNRLRKIRRPLSTPILRKRSSEALVNLPSGVEQIGMGIGFTYKIPAANHSKASICTSSAAGKLLGFGKSILRKVKSTPKFTSSSKPQVTTGLAGRRARGPPARIQTGGGRVVTPGLHSPAISEGPLTPDSMIFPPIPEIVGDPFAKDDPQTMIGEVHIGRVRLVSAGQKMAYSLSTDNL